MIRIPLSVLLVVFLCGCAHKENKGISATSKVIHSKDAIQKTCDPGLQIDRVIKLTL